MLLVRKEKMPRGFLESEMSCVPCMGGEGKVGSNRSLCLGALSGNPVWAEGSDACPSPSTSTSFLRCIPRIQGSGVPLLWWSKVESVDPNVHIWVQSILALSHDNFEPSVGQERKKMPLAFCSCVQLGRCGNEPCPFSPVAFRFFQYGISKVKQLF